MRMTREEAIQIFNEILLFGKAQCTQAEFKELVKMSIKALEQESTTKNDLGVDAVSRADVLKLMHDNWHTHSGDWAMQESMDDIRALPSVTPQEPQSFKWCTDCKEYDQEKHCCHRWSKVIRDTVTEIRQELEDIRAEVNKLKRFELRGKITPLVNADRVLGIIDKHIAESEEI